MQASTSTATAIVAAAQDASSPTTRRAPQEAPASSSPLPSSTANLAHFLEPSFDATAYVASLLHTTASAPATTAHPTLSSPTARKASLSPTNPTVASSQKPKSQAQEEVDLSLTISRLNLAIEELDRSISLQVDAHAPALLRRTAGLASMQAGVAETSQGVSSLDEQLVGLRGRVHEPFQRLVGLQRELRVVDGASGLVRRARGVVGLARRLEVQMEVVFGKGEKRDGEGEDAAVGQVHGRDLARAASLVAEITSLLDAEPKPSTSQPEDAGSASLHDLKLIQDLLPTITTARKTIVDYMEDMIVRGLRDLSPLMLGSSLQTAFNLRILPTLVQDLLNDLTQVVRERTAAAFDLDILSRQLQLPLPTLDAPAPTYSTYRSGRRSIGNTEDELKQQHHHQQQVWSEAVWKKLESLIVTEMGAVCSKVYLLEKVLKLKSDGETGVNFLGAALEVLGDKPSHTFWMTFAQSLREQVTLATGKSAWLAQLLSGGVRAGEGYPKFIRLFQEFFAKISLYTDVQYTTTHQSAETVILLKSLGGLETAYVEKSTGRIAEILSQVASPSGGRRPSVGEEEAGTVVRSITNVLDTTRFDPLLERAVVARCSALIDHFVSRLDSLTAKDDSAWTLTGDAGSPTQAQMWNASLVQFAYTLSQGLLSLAADQDGSAANAPSFASTRLATSASSIQNATRTTLLDPLLSHINTSLSSTMAKMHVQLASANASAEKKRGVSIDSTTGASGYATSICETLSYLRDELLPLYLSALRSAIAGRIARWVVELFCLHASVVALPLAEGGERVKLRLATDMTEFEFALTQLVGDHFVARTSVSASAWIVEEKGLVGQGDWMRTTKAFRRLLFLSLDEVEQETKGQALGLPSLLVVLHLFSRQSEVLDGVLRETLAIAVVGKKGKAQNVRSDFVGWVRSTSQSEVSGTITEALPDDAGLDETTDRIVRSLLAQS